MNYQNIHDKIIHRAKNRQIGKTKQVLIKEYGYVESHHIIPEFFYFSRKRKGPPGWISGNPNDKSNLVFLTAKEHMLVHLLLVKIYPNINGLLIACINMMGNSGKVSIRSFKELRESYAKIVSVRFGGKEKTVSHRENLSKSLSGRPNIRQLGKNNCMNKPGVAEKVAQHNRTRKHDPCSEETKKKIGLANTGHVGLRGEDNPGTWKISCLYCRKEVTVPSLTRWHTDCKI